MVLTKKKYNNIINANVDIFVPYLNTHCERFIYINNFINKLYKKDRENIRILDYGSHTGVLGILLKDMGFNVKCCDLQEVIEKYRNNYTFNDIEYKYLPESSKLPYGDNSFDLVIFTEILEHLYISPIDVLENIKGIVKPGGYLLVTTPNVMNLENKVKFLFNINIYQDIYRYCYNPRYSLHYREYTKKDLFKLFNNYLKFKELKFHYFNYAGGRSKISYLIQKISFIISNFVPSLRYCILVLARK